MTMYRSFFDECLATSAYESSSDMLMIYVVGRLLLIRQSDVLLVGEQSDFVGYSPDICANRGGFEAGAKCGWSSRKNRWIVNEKIRLEALSGKRRTSCLRDKRKAEQTGEMIPDGIFEQPIKSPA
jgi:hypothetical protein